MNALILHHNDWDGFAAGWIARRALADFYAELSMLPVDYGTAFPFELARDREVCILDFSWPVDVLGEAAGVAHSIVVIDHHRTAIAALEAWTDRPRNVFLELDTDKAGCTLALDFFDELLPDNPNDVAYTFIKYIADREFKLPQSKAVNAAIMSMPLSMDSLDELFKCCYGRGWCPLGWTGTEC